MPTSPMPKTEYQDPPWMKPIRDAVDASIAADLTSAGSVSLGALRDALNLVHPDAAVKFDTGSFPGEANSYRGFYDHLALEPCNVHRSARCLIEYLDDHVIGHTFTGYKGGDYVMGRGVPVWMASYGTTGDSRLIVGFQAEVDEMTLVTGEMP